MPENVKNKEREMPWIFKDLNEELRKDVNNIPTIIHEFYFDENIQKASFRGELYYLRKLLLAERHKKYGKEKEFYRLLYIGLCDYFLGAYDYAVDFLNMAMKLGVSRQIYPLILQIKNSIVRLPKTLIVVSFERNLSYNFLRLKDINRNIEVNTLNDFVDINDMLESWAKYDQVYLIGHGEGDEDGNEPNITLGQTAFTPDELIDFLETSENIPKILGVFSCGTAFDHPNIINKLDYFITDDIQSVPEFIEMFFNGFLTEYYYSYNIKSSFEKGKLATLFRSSFDPSYKIYARGTQLL